MKHRVTLSLLEPPFWEMLGHKQGGVWNKKRCLAQENPERAKHVCNQLLGEIRDIKRPEDHSKFNSHLLSPLGCQECLDQVCGSLSPAQCHFSKWGLRNTKVFSFQVWHKGFPASVGEVSPSGKKPQGFISEKHHSEGSPEEIQRYKGREKNLDPAG